MIRALQVLFAKRRLQKMTEARAASFETQLYRKNRNAQIARRKMRTGTPASHQSPQQ